MFKITLQVKPQDQSADGLFGLTEFPLERSPKVWGLFGLSAVRWSATSHLSVGMSSCSSPAAGVRQSSMCIKAVGLHV